jgi:DNA-binding transcriptional ArsR family regulator
MERIQLVDRDKARKAIFMAKTLEHKERQQILAHIMEAGDAGCTVTNIYTSDTFRNRSLEDGGEMEQSICSQHLKWLRDHGLVDDNRQGKYIIYTAKKDAIEAAISAINVLAEMVPELVPEKAAIAA